MRSPRFCFALGIPATCLLAVCMPLPAQWTLQDSGTTASLRGIHAVSPEVAWASGSHGTVLRTTDGGAHWQHCAMPDAKGDGAKLDFRGVQAFDDRTAVVMSSGTGALSRLYRTTDGCATWIKVLDDPDEKGFFDSLRKVTDKQMYLLGDPVGGKYAMFTSRDAGATWLISDDPGLDAPAEAGAFAASNSALINAGPYVLFATGGPRAAVYRLGSQCSGTPAACTAGWTAHETPLAHGVAAAGVFSLAGRFTADQTGRLSTLLVAVGGVYDKPDATDGTAAYSRDGGVTWTPSATLPAGYRSAVAYSAAAGTWVAVGPNGTDVSADDGKTWRALKPAAADVQDADRGWNALGLPFVVGEKGRIAVLRDGALRSR